MVLAIEISFASLNYFQRRYMTITIALRAPLKQGKRIIRYFHHLVRPPKRFFFVAEYFFT